jgi:adenosylmethionine-8-amino-7-oxononanoate aminotransferase
VDPARSDSIGRANSADRPALIRGEGLHVWDAAGRRYLDAISGAFCVQLGYSRPDLTSAMAEASGRLPFARTAAFESAESDAYSREILDAAGPPFVRVLLASSGSEAVDIALKAAHRYQRALGNPERTRVAHLRGHFHGATLGAMRVSDYRPRRALYDAMLGVERVGPAAFCTRCFRGLTYPGCGLACAEEAGIGAAVGAVIGTAVGAVIGTAVSAGIGTAVGAIILETIPAAGLGAPVPPPGYLARIRRDCDTHGALWIADEVLTGFGRVGSLFAWQRLAERPEDAGACPDIVVFGKGAGAGYAAIGGVLLAERVARVLDSAPDGPFTHAQTYGGNPVACAVGRQVLAAMRGEAIYERVRELEGALRDSLARLNRHPHVYETRGMGFLWGLELVADRATGAPFPLEARAAGRLEAACRERGLLIYSGAGCADGERGDHILVAPPLVAGTDQFSEIAASLEEALKRTF